MKKLTSFCFIFLVLTNFSYIMNLQLYETDYFAYYIKPQNLIICSDKEYLSSNLILNEFENNDGYTCLINLRQTGIHRITLKVSKLDDKEGMFSDKKITLAKNDKKTALEIGIGRNSVFKNLDLISLSNKASFKKQFLVKLDEKGKVSFLTNNDCDLNKIDACNFIDAKDSLFVKKFIKLNFVFKEPNYQETILLEKETLLKKLDKSKNDECDPECVYGVCNEGDCLCQNGYMGVSCSIKLNTDDIKLGIVTLVLALILSLLLGVFIMIGLWNCCLGMISEDEIKDNSKEVDILEHWGKLNNTNTTQK